MRIRGTNGRALFCFVAALALAGCDCNGEGPPTDISTDTTTDGGGDGPPPDGAPCELAITGVNGRLPSSITKLTSDDDQDPNMPGIQVKVEVEGTGLADGTDVGLAVTSLAPDPTQQASGGKATFDNVSVAAELTVVVIKAYAAGCKSASVQFSVEPPPECTFLDPTDGAWLGQKDDKDPTDQKFTYDVRVQTQNASTGTVTLFVDGNKQTDAQVGPTEEVTFADTVLPPDKTDIELKAEVVVGQVTQTCTAKVNVKSGLPKCDITAFTPTPVDVSPPVGPAKGLGVAQDADTSTPGVETNIEVATDPLVDQVTIIVDQVPGQTVQASGGTATFDAVPLTDGSHSIKFSCVETSTQNASESAPADLLVDSEVPAKVADFSCTVDDNRAGKIKCTWTAVGDTGTTPSGMELYQVRYTVGTALTTSNWDTATKAPDVTAFPSGTQQEVVLTGLPLAQTYYIGVVAADFVQNTSDLSASSGLAVDFEAQERALSTATGWGGIVTAGDFNCDGHSDVAVGAPEDNGGMGRVYIYLGNPNGVLQTPEKIISGTVAGGKFGSRVIPLANFDNDADNCMDLAVYASHGGTNQARLFVYLGRKLLFDREDVTTSLGAELIYQLGSGAASTEVLGPGMASAGDFDNDGATDLMVTHSNSASGVDSATVLVVYGDSTLTLMGTGKNPVQNTLPGAAGVTVTGGKASESFGQSAACGSLLDSDSYTDLLFGAAASGATGAAYVVKGGARASTPPEVIQLTSTRVIKITGGTGNTAFGTTVAFVGDMDKDGTPEFAVGDPTVASSAGEVYIFNLKTTPASASDAAAKVANNVPGAAGDKFGFTLGCSANFSAKDGADLDGDSYADLLAGSETLGTTGVGAVFQIAGAATLGTLSTSQAAYTFTKAGAPSFGAAVVMAKDINGDGYVDVIIGDPNYNSGKGRIFIYY
jgi:hypothetical protein